MTVSVFYSVCQAHVTKTYFASFDILNDCSWTIVVLRLNSVRGSGIVSASF